MNQLQLVGAIEIGLIYALVAVGVYITFKIIDFPDLTVDGSFTLGASVCSSMIVLNFDPYTATFCSIFVGFVAGMLTGYLNVRWNILGLLSGILVMSALYSVNLRIMQRPNITLIDSNDIFIYSINWSLFVILVVVTLILTRFFASNYGLAMRSIAMHSRASSAYGINTGNMKMIALGVSNSIVSLAGALFCQSQGFADISMGSGTVLIGLASVIMGETLLRPGRIFWGLVACAIGSIVYRIVIALALNAHDLGLEASDLNLLTSVFVILTMIAPRKNILKRTKS